MLRKWLDMIFGPNGDHVIQKMQDFSQEKLDKLFDGPELQSSDVNQVQKRIDKLCSLNCEIQNGKASLTLTENGCKIIMHGYFHQSQLVGNAIVIHLDQNGASVIKKEWMFLKKGMLHGYYLCKGKTKQRFGLFLNGHCSGPVWKKLEGGSFLFRPDNNLMEGAFIYPDLKTVLFGLFDNKDTIIEAHETTIESVRVNPLGMLEPKILAVTEKLTVAFTNESEWEEECICASPLQEDPYERKIVQVKSSSIPNAGEGLFARQVIAVGQIVAFFNGVPISNSDQGSDYSIKYDDGTSMLDIPKKCQSTSFYKATLAHKICHSFGPNAEYSYAFHPRFGKRIRCAIAITQIQPGDEITCNYKYKLDKAPEWYKESLRNYLGQTNLGNLESILKLNK